MTSDQRPNNIVHLEIKVEALSKEVAELNKSIEGLLDAWRASRGLLSVIRWLAGIASGMAVIWAAWHNSAGH